MSGAGRAPRRDVDGILLLDKPLGISSNRALQEVRRLFRADKAGHTGSLDPLATGLLPVCFGEGTKLSGVLLDSDKRYLATARVGVRTSTGDAEGQPVAHSDPALLDPLALSTACRRLTGPILQVPPMYSALKHEGRRLYEIARSGREVDREARPVRIHELNVVSHTQDQWVLDVRCSKGTYIRTLVEDLAALVGQCAHLIALRRTEVDPFGGGLMHTLEDVERLAEAGDESLDQALLPLVCAVVGWPQVVLPDAILTRMSRGQAVAAASAVGLPEQTDIAVVNQAGRLLALARRDDQGLLAPRRWLGGEGFT